jgi:serine protease Do
MIVLTGCSKPSDKAKIEELQAEVNFLNRRLAEEINHRRENMSDIRRETERAKIEAEKERQQSERERSMVQKGIERQTVRRKPAKTAQEDDPFGTPEKPGTTSAKRGSTELLNPDKDPQQTGAVVVIEGDVSTGTGFIVQDGEKYYLYTAAHVFSGNSRLSVVATDGRKFTKFGTFEAAEGADLIRLEMIGDEPDAALQIAEKDASMGVGTEIMVLGNGGGAGVVTAESGKIVGLGAESIEVDAEVIQGNSGGPVIERHEGRVVGLVTHLTAKREDLWSEGTRLGGVRRFACRLNYGWKWKTLPLVTFLAEARQIKAYDRMTRIGFAVGSLEPSPAGMRLDTEIAENVTAVSILVEAQDIPVIADLMRMNAELAEKKLRVSQSDLRKRFRSMLATSYTAVNAGKDSFDPSGFSWFHRKDGEQSIIWRDKANELLRDRADAMAP